jgi:hypothetical protein
MSDETTIYTVRTRYPTKMGNMNCNFGIEFTIQGKDQRDNLIALVQSKGLKAIWELYRPPSQEESAERFLEQLREYPIRKDEE